LWTSKITVSCNCVEKCVSVHLNLTLRVSDYSTLAVMVQGGKFLCICICIHVNVCHVYIIFYVCIYTCVYLVRVDLDIILLVVSDGDDSAKCWKALFENARVFEVHELVYSSSTLSQILP